MSRLLRPFLRFATGDGERADNILGDLEESTRTARRPRLARARAVAMVGGALLAERARRATTSSSRLPAESRPGFVRAGWAEFASALVRLRRRPLFTLGAAATIALGIGITTAIFSVVNPVVLQPLPYPDGERVVKVWPGGWMTKGWVMMLQTAESFEALSAFQGVSGTLAGDARPRKVDGASVFGPHFAVVGVEPSVGRAFRDEDHELGAEATVVISHQLWVERFGADTAVVGRMIDFADGAGSRRRLVGVMPAGYQPLRSSWNFWIPTPVRPESDYPGSQLDCTCRQMVGRLAPDATLSEASTQVAALAVEIQAGSPDRMSRERLESARVLPLLDHVVSPYRSPLMLVFGASALVLLIACANVANLLLVRGQQRRHEIAVRLALGASVARIRAQLLCESLVLGLIGAAFALPIARVALSYFHTALDSVLPRASTLSLDGPALGFAMVAGVVAGLVFGSWPALRLPRGSAQQAARRDTGDGHRANRLLVVAEVALAVVLVIGAGLLVRSVTALVGTDPGFDPDGLLTLSVSADGSRYEDEVALGAFHEAALAEIAALPGVASVGTIHTLPFGGNNWGWDYTIDSEELGAGAPMPNAGFRMISPGYMTTLGVPVLAGRDFESTDTADAEPVALVNEAFARRHFDAAADALGHVITLNTGRSFSIVGVVRGVRQNGFGEDSPPAMFRPHAQMGSRSFHFVVRGHAEIAGLGPDLSEAVWRVDPEVPVGLPLPMTALMRESVREPRLYRDLLSAFALLGLALAAIGVYGVVAYTVSLRRRTIAIRLALGASRTSVRRAAVREALAPVMAGALVGTLASLGASRLLSGLLFGIQPLDLPTFAVVPGLIVLVAAVAAYGPAFTASRLDPASTLRSD